MVRIVRPVVECWHGLRSSATRSQHMSVSMEFLFPMQFALQDPLEANKLRISLAGLIITTKGVTLTV